ncbi:NF-kappa-B-repressing factor-like [Megalops cyprinoides]|uniref:NF-kappa-B-repressing factor-like n=1 Tax=Megalops cyprinoides TaxID=118141 RepID=UPI001863DDE5|nr:NF-kappa-B-repressing factor-like [Megalops cyprinoides]
MAASVADGERRCQADASEQTRVNVDDFRQHCESEKRWWARRQFILKHVAEFGAENRVDQLLSLSMVWANHVFMGCRYGPELTRKVLEMAEGIDVGEMPSFQLVPGAEAKKRPSSAHGSEEPLRKLARRPHFEPVRFVSGSGVGEQNSRRELRLGPPGSPPGAAQRHTPPSGRDPGQQECGLGRPAEGGRGGLGCGLQDALAVGGAPVRPPHPAALEEKQRLISQVSAAVGAALRDPAYSTGTDTPNYNMILTRSIQACKTNPEYAYVRLQEIPAGDRPRRRKLPAEGFACELRCRGVYLATGYAGSRSGARGRAAELAVKLLLQPVEVRAAQRRHKLSTCSDLVVCQTHLPTPALVPALRSPEDTPLPGGRAPPLPGNQAPPLPSGQALPGPRLGRRWSDFVIVENDRDAVCILNSSAASNHMQIQYKFEPEPGGRAWRCGVHLQGELLARASGTKKAAKHAAAEEALKRLRLQQARQQPPSPVPPRTDPPDSSGKKPPTELVILENSDNAVCIINDTAQFNRVTADYRLVALPDQRWRCEVFLEGRFVAAAVGPKKAVKQLAAEEALARLRLTQAVVKSSLRRDGDQDAVSRGQIRSRRGEAEQEIREDNIGRQLLRKMGWRGGGLGREGGGIAEPIRVKEQLSREGLGRDADRPGQQLSKRDIEETIRSYASSQRQDDLRFSCELSNEERKHIHQVALRYGLRSKSYGQGAQRFLVVSRKMQKEQLISQLLQEGQVGRYELVKPQPH